MQQGDYNSVSSHPHPYHQNPSPFPTTPNPNFADLHQNSYESAPPFASSCAPSDFPVYPPNYPPFSQNSDPVPPPSAPSYNLHSPVLSATGSALNLDSVQPSFNPPQQSQPPSFYGAYQPPVTQQSYYPPFDQNQSVSSYASPPPHSIAQNSSSGTNSPYCSVYSAPPCDSLGLSVPSVFENPAKFDYSGGYFDDKYGSYGRDGSDFGSDLYNTGCDGGYGDGVYPYEGGRIEPYGARGTAPKSSTSALFDDYGRAINIPSSAGSDYGLEKIVRAVPKVEAQQDVKSGVQKFRVKLLAESGAHSPMDVLCQIGLDGIRVLDPNTSRTLRIYPLENITRCDKTDSSTFAFWSKSSVDVEPSRIRLQSNSNTTNTLLDTVTAAIVQMKEMGPRSQPTDLPKTPEESTEKKKGLVDWMNLVKPGNEEKDHWVPDEAVSKCTSCGVDFGAFVRRHHCRNCGDIFCDKCTQGRIALTAEENALPVRVCDRCMAEVTQRLSNAKEAGSKTAGLQSHVDLARKLQEEMEKNRKASSGSNSDGGYGRQMKEVACPTCTVHLQVQVPSSGSQTIECGVCQYPFLVSAN